MRGLLAALLPALVANPAAGHLMSAGNDPFDVSADFGDDDDSGADYMGDDEIGAAVRRTLKKKGLAPTKQNVSKTIKSRLAATGRGGDDPGRVQMLPINSTGTIAGGATGIASANPQRQFRADRFTVSPSRSSAGAELWLVNSINIGVDPQFVATSGAVAGSSFDPQATAGANMRGSTAVPGIDITVSVTNFTVGALTFYGSFTGPSLD